MALLRSAFPNTRIEPETTVNLWYSLYCNEDFAVARKATEIVITTCDFFPSHNKFREALHRARVIMSEETKPKQISALSEDSVNKKIQTICDWWEKGEIDY